jgi:hypothetical protein
VELEGPKKTIIYLDQFVVSGIVKALDPEFPRRERLDPFWLELYKKLDRLLRLQLIVCPDSIFHQTESLLSGDSTFEAHQDVYGYLSNGCTFQNEMSILRWQIHFHFRNYLDGNPDREPSLDPEEVVHGDLNEWQNKIDVTVPYRFNATEVAALRSRREQQHERIKAAFGLWQEDATSFKKAVEEEALSFGRAVLEVFWEHVRKRLHNTITGKFPLTLEDLLPSPGANIVYELFQILQEEHGIDDIPKQLEKVAEYFQSPHILHIPFVRLSAMLYASIARKTQAGRRSEPNQGTITDVTAIASLLPYCDVMVVDNEMATYLREVPLREEVKKFGTKIFSPNSKKDFLAFLEGLEAKASKGRVALVEHHYGKGWLEPYLDLVAHRKERRKREKEKEKRH